jgi:dTMP kinase
MPLVTFEGIEGCGKSSQARRSAAYLRERGREVRLEREPGGTPIGARLRALLLDPNLAGWEPLSELLLMEADRRQHVAEVIAPALERGELVLCDRFSDATFAYQGGGRNLPVDLIQTLERATTGPVVPDMTLLYDCPVAVGLARARHRDGENGARFESEPRQFHERVRSAYLEIARREPGRVRVIDAANAEDAVFERTRALLDEIVGAR